MTNTTRSGSAFTKLVVGALLALGLAACAREVPQSATTRGLDSGITSSFGGGDQTLGRTPNPGVTTRVSP